MGKRKGTKELTPIYKTYT